jgi:hypothetical protein
MTETVQGSRLDFSYVTKDGKKGVASKDAVVRVEQKDNKTTIIGLSDGTSQEVSEPIDSVLKVLNEPSQSSMRQPNPMRPPGGRNRPRRSTPDPILSNTDRIEKIREVAKSRREKLLRKVSGEREEPATRK